MLLCAFTYKSFVISSNWIFLWDLLWQQVNAQYTIRAVSLLVQGRQINTFNAYVYYIYFKIE